MMNVSFVPSICIHRSIILIFTEKSMLVDFFPPQKISFSDDFLFSFPRESSFPQWIPGYVKPKTRNCSKIPTSIHHPGSEGKLVCFIFKEGLHDHQHKAPYLCLLKLCNVMQTIRLEFKHFRMLSSKENECKRVNKMNTKSNLRKRVDSHHHRDPKVVGILNLLDQVAAAFLHQLQVLPVIIIITNILTYYYNVVSVGWLLSQNMQVYLRDGAAQATVCAATLRQKQQIKLATPSSHSILKPGQPIPVLTL